MASDAENQEQSHDWIKRITWCLCDFPFDEPLEAIVSLVIEGYLTPQDALVELNVELEILKEAESMPMAVNESKAANDLYYETVKSDMRIAVDFVEQVAKQSPSGINARKKLLERVIAKEREGRERK